jgi:hypothetical protein
MRSLGLRLEQFAKFLSQLFELEWFLEQSHLRILQRKIAQLFVRGCRYSTSHSLK